MVAWNTVSAVIHSEARRAESPRRPSASRIAAASAVVSSGVRAAASWAPRVSSHSRSCMRSLRERWSRSSMRLTDAVIMVSGRRTT